MTPEEFLDEEFYDHYLMDHKEEKTHIAEMMEAYAEKRVKEEKVKMLEGLGEEIGGLKSWDKGQYFEGGNNALDAAIDLLDEELNKLKGE